MRSQIREKTVLLRNTICTVEKLKKKKKKSEDQEIIRAAGENAGVHNERGMGKFFSRDPQLSLSHLIT